MIKLHKIENSFFESNTYIVWDSESRKGCIIDCGDSEPIFKFIETQCLSITSVLLTHAHFDHIYGLNKLLESNPDIKVYTNESGALMLADARKNMSFYHETPFVFEYPASIEIVKDRDKIKLGDDLCAEAVFTPGHNESCISWVIGDYIFTGDTFIPGLKTVTKLLGGDKLKAAESERIIKELVLRRHLTVCPGHGEMFSYQRLVAEGLI